MTGPQEAASVISQLPGLAKAIETSGILLAVVIFCVLIFEIVKLVINTRARAKNGNPGSEGCKCVYHTQMQQTMATVKNTDELVKKVDTRSEGQTLVLNDIKGLMGQSVDATKEGNGLLRELNEKFIKRI